MNWTIVALVCQVVLLAYHQITTWTDLYPFNGARFYSRQERLAESGTNAVLMGLPIVGFGLRIHGLMTFGVIYYFVLFGIEILIWWVPFIHEPRGGLRRLYNFGLACATSSFGHEDALENWKNVYNRIHGKTLSVFSKKPGEIVPNTDHCILHSWTLVTALVTLVAYRTV